MSTVVTASAIRAETRTKLSLDPAPWQDQRMARAIIRSSINGPSPNNVQSTLRGVAENVGFRKIGTAAYEGNFPTSSDAMFAVNEVVKFLDSLPPGFDIDHLWVYVDRN